MLNFISNNKEKIINTITYLSVMVLGFYLLEMIYVASQTLIWSLKVDSYFSENILLENGKMFDIHTRILISAIMLLFLSVFKKHIKIYWVALILIFNDIFPIYNFIEFDLIKYLDLIGAYDWRKNEGQLLVNPQWTNVYLLCIGLIALSILVFRKKTRSIDRIFAYVIALSVTITLIVFHSLVVFGYYKFQRENQVNTLIRQVKNEKKENFCENRICFNISYYNNGKNFNAKTNNVDNTKYLKNYPIIQHYVLDNYNKPINKVSGYHLQNPETIGFDYFTIAIIKETENNSILVIDNNNHKYSEINIVWFSFLAGIAHTIWIILGYGVLFFHKDYLFKRRIKLKKNNNDNIKEKSKEMEIK